MEDEGYIRVSNFSDCFSICIIRGSDFSWPAVQNGRWTGEVFGAPEKEAILFNALGVFDPASAVGGRILARDFHQGKWDKLWQQFEESLAEKTKDFPLIRRLSAEYNDAKYTSTEVIALREECYRVRPKTNDEQATLSLDVLIRCCDQAIESECGLFFASN
jgi:hypothetical protein